MAEKKNQAEEREAPALNPQVKQDVNQEFGSGPGPNPARNAPDHAPTDPANRTPDGFGHRQDNQEVQPAPSASGGRWVLVHDEPATPAGPEQVVTEPAFQVANIAKGGLTTLARLVYGSGEREFAQAIFEANRDTMISPDQYTVGQVVRIPKLTAELAARLKDASK
jgi:nucleoid-associated protein YgaU